MRANELMVGDWAEFHCGYGKVTGITDAGVHFEDRFGAGIASGAEPIPLTPQILEKNEFTNGEFYAESHIEDWQIMSDGSHLAARSERGWCIDIPCRYVHQLQQALRICQIEKEITI